MDTYESRTPEYSARSREPCPDRIIDDAGGAFAMGAVGGSLYHFIKGIRNAPRGERFNGGIQSIRMNAPRVAGGFAVWGGLYSAIDCSVVYIRQKEDPWNSIIAGGCTGGFLRMREGFARVCRASVGTAVFFALVEGLMIMVNKQSSFREVKQGGGGAVDGEEMRRPSSHSLEYGRLFKSDKSIKEEEMSGGRETELFESSDI